MTLVVSPVVTPLVLAVVRAVVIPLVTTSVRVYVATMACMGRAKPPMYQKHVVLLC